MSVDVLSVSSFHSDALVGAEAVELGHGATALMDSNDDADTGSGAETRFPVVVVRWNLSGGKAADDVGQEGADVVAHVEAGTSDDETLERVRVLPPGFGISTRRGEGVADRLAPDPEDAGGLTITRIVSGPLAPVCWGAVQGVSGTSPPGARKGPVVAAETEANGCAGRRGWGPTVLATGGARLADRHVAGALVEVGGCLIRDTRDSRRGAFSPLPGNT